MVGVCNLLILFVFKIYVSLVIFKMTLKLINFRIMKAALNIDTRYLFCNLTTTNFDKSQNRRLGSRCRFGGINKLGNASSDTVDGVIQLRKLRVDLSPENNAKTIIFSPNQALQNMAAFGIPKKRQQSNRTITLLILKTADFIRALVGRFDCS